MPKVYFLCTGNACRSQMAEGFAKKLLGRQWQVKSAGIEAHGLNSLAVKVMAEKGIDISQQQSKVLNEAELQQADLIVTLCGDARDRCPVTPLPFAACIGRWRIQQRRVVRKKRCWRFFAKSAIRLKLMCGP